MKIAVSACLLGTNCKYNGGNNYSETLAEYIKDHEVIPFCPEVEGGMPVPRPAVEIVNGRIQTKDGEDFDDIFRYGVQVVMERLEKEHIDMAILQSRSPSCGAHQIYDGSFTKTLIEGQGLLALALMKAGIKTVDIEEINKQDLVR